VQCKGIMSAVCCDSGLQCKAMASRRDVQTTGLEEAQRSIAKSGMEMEP